MTAQRTRRPRGSVDRENTRTLYAEVDASVKDRLNAMADTAGVTLPILIEQITQHIEVDERGLPTWWAVDVPQEELPLKTA